MQLRRFFALPGLVLALCLAPGPIVANAADSEFSSLRLGEGLAIQEFSKANQISNVTAFAIDEKGRVFIAEDGRPHAAALNARQLTNWANADLTFRTVDERSEFLQSRINSKNENLPEGLKPDRNGDEKIDVSDLEVERHRIHLLEDKNGDGKADTTRLYTEGFNSFLSGRISGMHARDGALYTACVPDLWLLSDSTGDGEINDSAALHHGFGVHFPRDRRDMTGPVMGPDGRLYWCASDRGSWVETTDIIYSASDTGAIFRSEPDGSRLELYAIGFQNPRGLAFNDSGDLFAFDAGAQNEEARLIHVAENGDYGWRHGWRIQPDAGVWKMENLGDLTAINTSKHILPPVVRMGNQPAGLAYSNAVGLPSRYGGRFLLADAANGGRIHTVQLKAKGASYVRADSRDFVRNLIGSDLQLAPDGSVMVLGRIGSEGTEQLYRIYDSAPEGKTLAAETSEILSRGMLQQSFKKLGKLLDHPSQQVRIAAQFELVDRTTKRRVQWKALELRLGGGKAYSTLMNVAKRHPSRIARLHAIWGLAQVRRGSSKFRLTDLSKLLGDRDPEIRAQTAKVVGETLTVELFDKILVLTQDPDPRVRYFATLSLARFRQARSIPAILAMVRDNQDKDPFLRHAAAVALASIGEPNQLLAAAQDADNSVRLAAALAMRRRKDPGIILFLNDSDETISREAARAIHDLPIDSVMPGLASRITQLRFTAETGRRIVNAAYLQGNAASARGLTEFAGNELVPEEQRVDALNALTAWMKPKPIDRVTGRSRTISLRRDGLAASEHLEPYLPRLLFAASINIRIAAAKAAAALEMKQAEESFEGIAGDPGSNVALRIVCLEGLATLNSRLLQQALSAALADPSPALVEAARAIQARPADGAE
ncbi:MAG: HEAT repeat domain-containing protein [Verrucomicrobiia bacterium]|jgi:quinoprotein glucose dehydrogenase